MTAPYTELTSSGYGWFNNSPDGKVEADREEAAAMTQIEDIEAKPRLGRKRDHTRDPEILEAALDVLAETGYDGMTIDMVATRAKAGKATLYRRWSSKADLVLDAVVCMKSRDIDLDALPDTGTLRGDLIAMIKTPSIRESERKLKVMAGIASMIARSPELAVAAQNALVEPRASVNRIFFRDPGGRRRRAAVHDLSGDGRLPRAHAGQARGPRVPGLHDRQDHPAGRGPSPGLNGCPSTAPSSSGRSSP
jgi:AcrR family transcriptional regulator